MSFQSKPIPFIELYHINAQDVVAIYGCHIETSRRMLRSIKKDLGKDNKQLVTLEEFAKATGLSIEFIHTYKRQQFS